MTIPVQMGMVHKEVSNSFIRDRQLNRWVMYKKDFAKTERVMQGLLLIYAINDLLQNNERRMYTTNEERTKKRIIGFFYLPIDST